MNLLTWLRSFQPPAEVTGEALVWLDPYRQPRTAFEEQVYALLAGGPLPLPQLVELLAEWEVRTESAVGNWSLVTGAEALPELRCEVEVALASLDGRQVAIETPLPQRSAAQQHWALRLCA